MCVCVCFVCVVLPVDSADGLQQWCQGSPCRGSQIQWEVKERHKYILHHEAKIRYLHYDTPHIITAALSFVDHVDVRVCSHACFLINAFLCTSSTKDAFHLGFFPLCHILKGVISASSEVSVIQGHLPTVVSLCMSGEAAVTDFRQSVWGNCSQTALN